MMHSYDTCQLPGMSYVICCTCAAVYTGRLGRPHKYMAHHATPLIITFTENVVVRMLNRVATAR